MKVSKKAIDMVRVCRAMHHLIHKHTARVGDFHYYDVCAVL